MNRYHVQTDYAHWLYWEAIRCHYCFKDSNLGTLKKNYPKQSS